MKNYGTQKICCCNYSSSISIIDACRNNSGANTVLCSAKRGTEADFPDTSSLKHAVRDGVSANLSHRDQHMNQQNLCYRANTCRQSDVGQNTLGNDNQVTGFADQSDNIQQAAPTNQTTNQTGSGGGGGGGGSGTTSCVTLTISGLTSGSVNQTADVQVCLIPDVVSTVNIPGIGPTLVVLVQMDVLEASLIPKLLWEDSTCVSNRTSQSSGIELEVNLLTKPLFFCL